MLEDRVTPTLTPQMVLDINQNTLSSNPSGMVAVGSTTFFVADDGINGQELWKSDGTVAGTVLVKDICPGSAGAFFHNGYFQNDWLTNVNGTLFFVANDGTTGWELWKSDGTEAGTVLVKDIYPGSFGSFPSSLTNVNGTLFFSAHEPTTGTELWKSDGTAAGTVLVKDIKPGWASSNPSNLTNVNGTLFFSSYDYFRTYSELWKSDGTAAGTVLVKEFDPHNNGNNYPSNLTNVNGTLFFSAHVGVYGVELWKSDGTVAGTVLVKDIVPGSIGSYPSSLTNVNGTLFFSAYDGTGNWVLWKSNGTAAGTTLVKDISYPTSLTNVNGTLFFTANSGINGLWKSDGTAAGTVLVSSVGGSDLTNVNGTLFFSAYDGTHGTELWKSDGTAAGTVLVKDFFPASSAGSYPTSLTNVNGTLFFTANDGRHGVELWKSDGTEVGTTLVKDINTESIGSNPRYQTDVNGTLFLSADDGAHGFELWKSDGTAAGTTLVKDIFPGGYIGYYGGYYPNSSFPRNLTNVNGTLFFTSDEPGSVPTLWKSDGTAAGTVELSSLARGPRDLTNVNGTLFFRAEAWNGRELWKSDGTAAGTTLVKDIYPGGFLDGYGGYLANSSYPSSLTNVNGTLFFAATDGTNGRELWKSDGTAAGTVLVKDIRPGSAGSYSYLRTLTDVDGTLFFAANNGVQGYELWKSDGTAAGTVLVKDIRSGSTGSYPDAFSNLNGTLLFSANDGATGYELWKSDGTAAGTVLVKDIRPGIGNSYPGDDFWVPGSREVVDDILFFTANDGAHGRELWKSDGTTAGTTLVKDIYPGIGSPYYAPRNLTDVNGKLFFLAYDSTIWQSDGTDAGTLRVANLVSNSLTNVGGTLFFTADDGIHGWELWTLVDEAPTVAAVTIGDGSAQRSRVASLTVTFSAQVTFAGTVGSAFTLTRAGGGAVNFTATASVIGGVTVVTLAGFTGNETQFGSLKDGRYTLTALASQISAGGLALDGNGDGTPGDNYTFGDAQGLFRFYGDINGDRHVDIADFGLFSSTFNLHAGQTGFLAAFDFNGDGVIDIADFGQFSIRMFTVLP